jgi:hypothetical protein
MGWDASEVVGPSNAYFLSPMIGAERRNNKTPLALLLGNTTRSTAANALQGVMLRAQGGEEKWLLEEISLFNSPSRWYLGFRHLSNI